MSRAFRPSAMVTLKLRTAVIFTAVVIASSVDAFDRTGPGGGFRGLNEPPLKKQPHRSPYRIYRVIISPTWGNVFCLRIKNTSSGATLTLKRLDGQAGFDAGTLAEEKSKELTVKEFLEFEALVAKTGYEQMGTRDPKAGLDGDSWSLEVSKADFYHQAVRWCPNAYNPKKRGTENFVAACRWLADKAGVTELITNKGKSVFKR